MAIDVLSLQTGAAFDLTQCAVNRAGLGRKFAPRLFSTTNTYSLGDTELTEINGVLTLKMFVPPEDTDYVDISISGSELDPTETEVTRLATLKEIVIAMPALNPDDKSDAPDSVTLTLSDSVAKALGFSGGPLVKTLKVGESFSFSIPPGNDVATAGRITVVNNDTMNYATVMVYAAGFVTA